MARIHQLANATLALVFTVTLVFGSRLYVEQRSAKNHLHWIAQTQTKSLPL
jgi:hypothetical protein